MAWAGVFAFKVRHSWIKMLHQHNPCDDRSQRDHGAHMKAPHPCGQGYRLITTVVMWIQDHTFSIIHSNNRWVGTISGVYIGGYMKLVHSWCRWRWTSKTK